MKEMSSSTQVRSRPSKEFCRHEGRCLPVYRFGVGLVRSFVDMKEMSSSIQVRSRLSKEFFRHEGRFLPVCRFGVG